MIKKLLKKSLCLVVFLLLAVTTFGQSVNWSDVPDLAGYSVVFRSVDATCYNNGRLEFAIVDHLGNPVSMSVYNSLKLDNLQIARKGTQIDTTMHRNPVAQYVSPWTSVPMETGTFRVTLECAHKTVDKNGDSTWIQVNISDTITVNLLYEEMHLSALSSISYDGDILGNIPTLGCVPTGRMLTKVRGGRGPYHFVMVRNNTTDTLYDTVFTQSYYEDELAKYFKFDNVPEGDWAFYLVDGCGSTVPHVVQHMDTLDMPHLKSVSLYASSGNPVDSNVIKVKAYFDTQFPYYMEMFADKMQYRFLVEGYQGSNQAWKPLPYDGSLSMTLYDTVRRVRKYCDILNERITLQVKVDSNFCRSYTDSVSFVYKNLDRREFIPTDQDVTDSVVTAGGCSAITTYFHKDNFAIRYSENQPNYLNPNQDHSRYRYHFTYPIVWEYRPFQQNEIVLKRDTIWNDISLKSVLTADEVREVLGNVNSVHVIRTLVDAKGCPLYSDQPTFIFETQIDNSAAPSWTKDVKDPVCRTEKRIIKLIEKNGPSDVNYDGLTIRLLDSPEGKYNFRAVYHPNAAEPWSVSKERIDNWAHIDGGNGGRSLEFWDYALPSGYYTFEISNAPCQEDQTISVYLKELVSAEMVQEPVYELSEDCDEVYLTYTQGSVAKTRKYRNQNVQAINDDVETVVTQPLTTFFELVSGPVGGYDPYNIKTYTIGQSIRLSMQTDSLHPYIFKIYPDAKPSDICGEFVYYDTVFYEGRNARFDFANALLCNSTSNTGNVYMRAKGGTPPYTYKLYQKADLGGELLGTKTDMGESDIAVFLNIPDVHIDSVMSGSVVDHCGSGFKFDLQPQSLADLQKVWFNDGLQVTEMCEGSTVKVHTMQVGAAFVYKWYLNDATEPFYEGMEPEIFLPRNAEQGVYHVVISETNCEGEITDSVVIYPKASPSVQITAESVVCPEQEVPVTVTVHSPYNNPVSFKVVFENRDGKDTVEYDKVANNGSVTIMYPVSSNTIVYPIYISDSECDYFRQDAGNTAKINISNNVVDPCKILTTNTHVCYLKPATVTASVSETVPIVDYDPLYLTWCSDYSLTDTLQRDTLYSNSDWASYTRDSLMHITYFYVAVEKTNWCPSSNLFAMDAVNIGNGQDGGVTRLMCTDSYLFCDDGGAYGNYSPISGGGHQEHLFISQAPGHPVTLHLNELDLSLTSHLIFFSGSQPLFDSILCELNSESIIPDVIVSNSDTLLAYFIPGEETAAGWSAFVRPAPGIAVADVYPHHYTLLADTVCQSQVNDYYDRHNFAKGDPDLIDQLNNAVRHSRTYLFERDTVSKVTGCDSTIALNLLVTPPPYDISDSVVLSLDTPVVWKGLNCSETGQYIKYHTIVGNCDSVSYLNLIVLLVDTSTNEICIDSVTKMGLRVVTPDMGYYFPRPAIGDVLCSDGDILHPDDFMAVRNTKTPIGVVFYLDPTDPRHLRGRAMSLYDAAPSYVDWAYKDYVTKVHSATNITSGAHVAAMADMNGYANTQRINTTASNEGEFQTVAPAAWYCWYYDPIIHGPGTVHKYWYLPSLGELNYAFANRATINKTLIMLQGIGCASIFQDVIKTDAKYWTSTESGNAAYSVSSKGQLNNRNGKGGDTNNKRYVRAVIQFPLNPNM
jgi:hypothetical protein